MHTFKEIKSYSDFTLNIYILGKQCHNQKYFGAKDTFLTYLWGGGGVTYKDFG